MHEQIIFAVIFVVVILINLKAGADGRRLGGTQRTRASGGGMLDWIVGLRGLLQQPDRQTQQQRAASEARQAEIVNAIRHKRLPQSMQQRLQENRNGTTPWVATLSPAELQIVRSHGLRPIAAVSATCWMQYGWSWTEGHAQGWHTALNRLREEAKAAGANAVVDVKMRTVNVELGDSMDFSLIGTAVRVEGLPPSADPVVATVPALEFVKLLDANIVPTGIAVGAAYEWINDWYGGANLFGMGNIECQTLSALWERVRRRAHAQLRQSAQQQGNGSLAHINFSQMFEREGGGENQPKQYLGRHIVIATTVDSATVPEWAQGRWPGLMGTLLPGFQMVVDLHEGKTPLTRKTIHHQSYTANDTESEI